MISSTEGLKKTFIYPKLFNPPKLHKLFPYLYCTLQLQACESPLVPYYTPKAMNIVQIVFFLVVSSRQVIHQNIFQVDHHC